MIRRGGPTVLAAFACAALPFGSAASAFSIIVDHVPFVGCPLDGQMGPAPAPTAGPRPLVEAPGAFRLAYYGASGLGVLAPRDWHCVAVSGSNGISVVVTPDRRDPSELLGPAPGISGPGVSINHMFGGTSGRFSVARAIARYFPSERARLPALLRNYALAEPLPTGPWPGDRITRRNRHEIRFTTPRGRGGEGNSWLFAPEGGAVVGTILLLPDGPDVVTVRARLPRSHAHLAELVLAHGRGLDR